MAKYNDGRCSRKRVPNKVIDNDTAVNSAKRPDEYFRDLQELEYKMYSPWRYRIRRLADYFIAMLCCGLMCLKKWFVMFGLVFIFVYSVLRVLGIL